MRNFWVYMLRCHDGSFYVGHTDDLDARLWQHEQGVAADWTRRRRPVQLVWCEEMGTRDAAFTAERRFKGWSVPKKLALIERDWERVSALSRSRPVRQEPQPSTDALRQAQDERS